MGKEFTKTERGNIMNNSLAISELKENLNLNGTGLWFKKEDKFTHAFVASFFNVSLEYLEKIIGKNVVELKSNGYQVLIDDDLREFKKNIQAFI